MIPQGGVSGRYDPHHKYLLSKLNVGRRTD